MIEKFIDRILGEDEANIVGVRNQPQEQKKDSLSKEYRKRDFKKLWPLLLIFFIALAPRLYFLFSHDTQNIGYDWYGDVYHHWQIAYLSKTIGFQHGFLRLWDLKGMEYFWGLLQPLVLAVLFTITNSSNIIILRLLSIISGAAVIVLVFLLVRRYFNASAAWASALFMAFMPVILFSDTLGMQEPLGLLLLLTGILLWPDYPVLTGLSWGFAALERADYWLFSTGLFIAALLAKRKVGSNPKFRLIVSWGAIIILYMEYLKNWTGNYIYPIYWNFLSSVVGLWFTKRLNEYLPHIYLSQTKIIMFTLLVIAAIASILVLIKQHKSYLFLLIGLFNIALVGFMFSIAAYTWGYIDRFWVDRLFSWPYAFAGILASILLLYFLPRKLPIWGKLKIGWIIMFLVLLITQASWKPILHYWDIAKRPWDRVVKASDSVGTYWDKKGKILLPENYPHFVYALVHFQGIKGEQIMGEMFDPFYYKTGKEIGGEMDQKFINWVRENDIHFIVIDPNKLDYKSVFDKNPNLFEYINDADLFKFYKVL